MQNDKQLAEQQARYTQDQYLRLQDPTLSESEKKEATKKAKKAELRLRSISNVVEEEQKEDKSEHVFQTPFPILRVNILATNATSASGGYLRFGEFNLADIVKMGPPLPRGLYFIRTDTSGMRICMSSFATQSVLIDEEEEMSQRIKEWLTFSFGQSGFLIVFTIGGLGNLTDHALATLGKFDGEVCYNAAPEDAYILIYDQDERMPLVAQTNSRSIHVDKTIRSFE